MSSKTEEDPKQKIDAENEDKANDKSSAPGPAKELPQKEEKKLTPEELKERYTLWGLGRGVDITKPTPWLDKTPFQVRAVCTSHLIETDEGGLLKGYSDVVNNSTTIHSQVRTGVKAPDVPLAIGVDAEYTRTDCSSKHVVGLKVKNRTISFKVDFDDLPKSFVKGVDDAKRMMQAMDKSRFETSEPMTGEHNPFENRLCKWLVDCLEHRGLKTEGKTLYQLLFTELANLEEDGPNERFIDNYDKTRELERDISHFVEYLGVTHYVSAIELGALHFSILTEKEYEKKVAASGNASLNSKLYGAIEATAKQSQLRKFKSRHTERKMIGRITKIGDKEVVEEEAVIGCQIRPISSLVRNPYLQLAIKKSVKEYTKTKISTGGPYLISCGDDDEVMYLAVDRPTKEIFVTPNKERAEAFSVKTVNETRHHHELEFSLTSSLSKCKSKKGRIRADSIGTRHMDVEVEPPDKDTHQPRDDGIVPLEYMLEVVVNAVTGRGGSAPRMRLSTNYKRTRLLLKKRSDRRISCDTKDWIKGSEAYYIQCLHPLMKGFLCVKERNRYRRPGGGPTLAEDVEEDESLKERFKVCVKGSASAHSDGNQFFMLFRLHHQEHKLKEKPERPKAPVLKRLKKAPKPKPVEEERDEEEPEEEGLPTATLEGEL